MLQLCRSLSVSLCLYIHLSGFSVCSFFSLQPLPVASSSLLYDSSEANRDNAEFLIVMGGDPLISPVTALVPMMYLPLHKE